MAPLRDSRPADAEKEPAPADREKERAERGIQSALFRFVQFDQIEDVEETVRIKVSEVHGHAVGLVALDHALGNDFHPAGGADQADFDGAGRFQGQTGLGYEQKAVEADIAGINLYFQQITITVPEHRGTFEDNAL